MVEQQENESSELLTYCLALVQNPAELDLQVESYTPTTFSAATYAILQELKQASQADLQGGVENQLIVGSLNDDGSSANRSVDSTRSKLIQVQAPQTYRVLPVGDKSVATDPEFSCKRQQTAVLKKALELLWRCESVLLVEFIEIAVPLLYGVSMSILYYLPNAKYYPGMAEMTPAKPHSTIASILVYFALEFVPLLYLHMVLKWRFQISALHQLTFVLEKQWMSVQGLLLTWVIIVLRFTLVHYGKWFMMNLFDQSIRIALILLCCICRKRFHLQVCVGEQRYRHDGLKTESSA